MESIIMNEKFEPNINKKSDLKKVFDALDPKIRGDIKADVRQKKADGMSREEIIERLKLLIWHGDYLSKMDESFSDLIYAAPPKSEEGKLANEIEEATWDADEAEDIDKLIEDAEKSKKPPDETVH